MWFSALIRNTTNPENILTNQEGTTGYSTTANELFVATKPWNIMHTNTCTCSHVHVYTRIITQYNIYVREEK